MLHCIGLNTFRIGVIRFFPSVDAIMFSLFSMLWLFPSFYDAEKGNGMLVQGLMKFQRRKLKHRRLYITHYFAPKL